MKKKEIKLRREILFACRVMIRNRVQPESCYIAKSNEVDYIVFINARKKRIFKIGEEI